MAPPARTNSVFSLKFSKNVSSGRLRLIRLDACAARKYLRGVILQRCETPLRWGALEADMFGILADTDGESISPPAAYALVADPLRLWFIAARAAPAQILPQARPGGFHANLWQRDVAELFLAGPADGRYFEFNLAPNGAWWSCEFTAPRVRADEVDIAFPEVATFADLAPDGGWLAAMAIPLNLLKARLDFGRGTTGNVAFILDSPAQRFLSASPLGGGPADFHQPGKFQPLGERPSEPGLP